MDIIVKYKSRKTLLGDRVAVRGKIIMTKKELENRERALWSREGEVHETKGEQDISHIQTSLDWVTVTQPGGISVKLDEYGHYNSDRDSV